MDLVQIAQRSIDQANMEKSKLSNDALMVDGMSSAKGRHLLNNLCNFSGVVYLEIGSWRGSTVIAAAYENEGEFYAIDHFKQKFHQTESAAKFLYENQKKFQGRADFAFFEEDSWTFDKSKIKGKVNVYFYDGDHSMEGTQKAFTYYDDVFANQFIMVMDDWNRAHIREATQKAIKNYKVLYEQQLYTPGKKNDPHGSDGIGSMKGRKVQTWWNGLYVAVLEKP